MYIFNIFSYLLTRLKKRNQNLNNSIRFILLLLNQIGSLFVMFLQLFWITSISVTFVKVDISFYTLYLKLRVTDRRKGILY